MSGAARVFIDTNVLVYQISGSPASKQAVATKWVDALWAARAGRVSWQVIHEFYSSAVQKLRIPAVKVRVAAEDLAEMGIEPVRMETLQRSWYWCDHAQLNYWDALILATAEQAGCNWLLSEDFQAGRRYGTVTIVNPFEREPAEFGLS